MAGHAATQASAPRGRQPLGGKVRTLSWRDDARRQPETPGLGHRQGLPTYPRLASQNLGRPAYGLPHQQQQRIASRQVVSKLE